jgi:hypothetical protein
MKMFRARWDRVEEFEIIKETEKQIVYTNEYGRIEREAKISDWQSWHKSKEEAVNFLIAKKQKEIDILQRQIDYKKEEMEKIHRLI